MGILLFIGFGYLVTLYGRPLQIAGAYVVVSSIFSLVIGEKIISLLFSGAIIFAYTAFVFMVVDHFSDSIFKPLLTLAVGAVVLFLGPAFI